MPDTATPLTTLIGYGGRDRPYESFYNYVARMIRINHLTGPEVRKFFPGSWLRLAFEPERASTALTEECSTQVPEPTPLAIHQTSIQAWLPMPSMESHPQERMRYCPECLARGLHSYAYQARFLLSCPYHGATLMDACANCGAPIAWRQEPYGYARGALRCVRGCDIGGNVLTGVLPPPSALTAFWATQWQWIHHFRRHVTAIIGPVYVMYPACQRDWGQAHQPTQGAFVALCDALHPFASDLPSRAIYHDFDHGAWTLTIQPWDTLPSYWSSGVELDTVLHTFERGAYKTVLPLPRSPWLDNQLKRLQHDQLSVQYRYEVRRGQPIDVLVFPSFLITNSELTALYRIVMASDEVDSATSLYVRSLVDTLDIAYRRRQAWDSQVGTDVLDIGERLDGLIRMDGRTFRVVGCAISSRAGAQAWETFTEQSYPGQWSIYLAGAKALRY